MLNCLKLLCWGEKKKRSRKEKKIQNIINITQEIIYSKKQKLIKEGGNIWQRNQRKEGKKIDIKIS